MAGYSSRISHSTSRLTTPPWVILHSLNHVNFPTPFCCISNKTHHNHLPIVCPCGILVIHIITLNILIPDDWLDYAFPPHNLKYSGEKFHSEKITTILHHCLSCNCELDNVKWQLNILQCILLGLLRIIHKLYFIWQAQNVSKLHHSITLWSLPQVTRLDTIKI